MGKILAICTSPRRGTLKTPVPSAVLTPEVTLSVAERNAPGIAEAMRYHSLTITPRGMLSRGVSVLRGKTLIVNLPGSPKAVKENLEYILPSLAHGIRLAAGLDGECARK